jgi:Family of unknown function (DUF6338)
MPEIKPEQFLLIAGFILPGAISMYVYGLKVPQKEFELKDRIAEAICFSMLNFVIVWMPVEALLDLKYVQNHGLTMWFTLFLGFVVAPIVWPLGLILLLQKAEKYGWIAVRARTAWDDFFGRQLIECWVQAELSDGRVVGGRYGRASFASSWPDPGHMFLEEMWKVDEDGYFADPVPGNAGLLLRPTDYKLIRVYKGVTADG